VGREYSQEACQRKATGSLPSCSAASIQTANENQHFFLEASSAPREQDKQEREWRSTGTPCWVAVPQPLQPRVRRVDLAFFRQARCFKHLLRQQPQQLLRRQM